MKIAHIAYRCVPGEYRGGVERVVLELASAQAGNGADVDVLAYSPTPLPDIQTDEGVRIRYFGGRRIMGVVSSPAMMAALRADGRPPDVLHSHSTFHPLNWQAARLARSLSRPIFYHPHGALDPQLFQGRSPRALKKRIFIDLFERGNLNSANAVFALSSQEQEQLRTIGVNAPIEVVPNGIADAPVRTASGRQRLRRKLGIDPESPVLLYLGRIVSKKRIEAILSAMALAREAGFPITMLIGGSENHEPDYTRSLRALVEELSLGRDVHWLGFLNEINKPDAFSAADIFVHASESEGMAMSILEAMATGLPTLVTPGCYMSEASAAGAVLEVAADPAEIGGGLARLIRNRDLAERIGKLGEIYVASNHRWPALAKRVTAAYVRHMSPDAGDSRH